MADLSKRTKKARKRAAKRAKVARKAASRTSTRTRAQLVASVAVAFGAAAAVRKLLGGSSSADAGEQRYTPEPDHLPNEPDRPATVTPMPGAA